MSYQVNVPNTEPETGVAPFGSPYSTAEEAMDVAREQAKSQGATGYATVTEVGDSTNTWSVQYRPEPPIIKGMDRRTGQAIVEWPVEWREVHDPTHVTQTFEVLDETGKVTGETDTPGPDTGKALSSTTVGTATTTDYVPKETPDA